MADAGDFIKKIREAQGIRPHRLAAGLCSRSSLKEIEENREECGLPLFRILLQRLGKCPDKLEYILSWKEYREERLRAQIAVSIFRGRAEWSERAVERYEKEAGEKGAVHRMYACRLRALAASRLRGDAAEAEEWLERALDTTFPCWRRADWTEYLISTAELENVLALVRMRRLQKKPADELLEQCGVYIEHRITDAEEHAKIYAKYAWLAAEKEADKGRTARAAGLCACAIEELRRNNIEYFMRPLLRTLLECFSEAHGTKIRAAEAAAGALTKERCRAYLEALEHLHRQFGKAWEPQSCLLWNCCRKAYYLESELFLAERLAGGMTQEETAEGIYRNAREIRKIERAKSSPAGIRFRQLLGKFGLSRGRRSGFVITNSFEVLELRQEIQGMVGRRRYGEIRQRLPELEQQLDMTVPENLRALKMLRNVIAREDGTRTLEELLSESRELLRQTYRVLPEEMEEMRQLRKAVRPGRGRPRKGMGVQEYGYRPPFQNETYLLNSIAILLKRLGRAEEAERLYGWLLGEFERSRVRPEYHYLAYTLLLGNQAALRCSAADGIRAVRYHLGCGKLGALANDYLTIACTLLDDGANRERCRRMIRECCCLFELSHNDTKWRITEEFYKKEFEGGFFF